MLAFRRLRPKSFSSTEKKQRDVNRIAGWAFSVAVRRGAGPEQIKVDRRGWGEMLAVVVPVGGNFLSDS